MKIILLMMLAIFLACPAFAGCGSVSYISERDLDLEADVIFLASNPEGPNAKNPYNRGFGRGPVMFTIEKVFKGELKERQKVDVEFLSKYAHRETGSLGALYFSSGVVAAKYNGSSLVSIGSPEGMCKEIKVSKERLASYFATEWNFTRFKSVFINYGYFLRTAYYFYGLAPIHIIGAIISLLMIGALFLGLRRKTAAKN